jgi:hypothetical protein
MEDALNCDIVGNRGALALDSVTIVGNVTQQMMGMATGPDSGPTSSGWDFNLWRGCARKMPKVQKF